VTGRQGFKDHFSQTASAYAAQRPRYPLELARYLAELAPARRRAWDAGCGSGQMSLLLAEHFARVVATDASAEQLAHATQDTRVVYVRARAEQSGVASRSTELAVSAQAAHWFDLPAYFTEIRRVVRRGGIIALAGYGNMAVMPRIDAVVSHFYYDVVGPFWPPERQMVEDAYRSIEFPFRETQAPEFQMMADWNLEQVLGYIGTWSAVWRIRKERGPEPFAEFRTRMAEAWGTPATVRRIVWPLALRVGVVD
jgi:SAM-dependent methyltransferase